MNTVARKSVKTSNWWEIVLKIEIIPQKVRKSRNSTFR